LDEKSIILENILPIVLCGITHDYHWTLVMWKPKKKGCIIDVPNHAPNFICIITITFNLLLNYGTFFWFCTLPMHITKLKGFSILLLFIPTPILKFRSNYQWSNVLQGIFKCNWKLALIPQRCTYLLNIEKQM
jgi:hypothetical protein